MLNGLAPIMLFQFYKNVPEVPTALGSIPVVGEYLSSLALPPIPVYLDERQSGILITAESKTIDIETKLDSKTNGGTDVNQKALGSTINVQMTAEASNLGVVLFSAFADLILDKVTSQEYSVTYMNGPIVLINGLLHSLSIDPEEGTTLYRINMVLTRGKSQAAAPDTTLTKSEGAVPLAAGPELTPVPAGPPSGTAPVAPLPTPPSPTFSLGPAG